jgi:four helix bundle suffix protein
MYVLLVEYQLRRSCRDQTEFVGILTEFQTHRYAPGILWAHEEEAVASSLLQNEPLEAFTCHRTKQSEEINEVALSRPIGSDQDVQGPQGEVLQTSEGFESLQSYSVDWPAHTLQSRSLPVVPSSIRASRVPGCQSSRYDCLGSVKIRAEFLIRAEIIDILVEVRRSLRGCNPGHGGRKRVWTQWTKWDEVDREASAMSEPEGLIPKHGGYRRLKSFQVAELVFDVTVRFCDRYIDRRSRTHDQMVQAARSGSRNIIEGSQASGTSKKTELKLTGVARASLEELRRDYLAFLRQRKLPIWDQNDPRRSALIARRCATAEEFAAWTRELHDGRCGRHGRGGQGGSVGRSTKSTTSTSSTYSEISANGALVLIAVAAGLLDRQLASLARAFENEGGFTERLYRVRSEKRRDPRGLH